MSTNTQATPQLEGMPLADPAAASPRNWDGQDRSGTLPVRPLRRWLRDYIIKVGGIGNAALSLRVNERTLWAILRQQSWVSIKVADRILIAADEPQTFYLLYPLEDSVGDVGPWALETESMFSETRFGEAAYERWCPWCTEHVVTEHTGTCPQCRRTTQPFADTEGAI